jgi:Carboxypeptidase regulatory-like domain
MPCRPVRTILALLACALVGAPATAATLDGQVLPPAAAAVARIEIWPACAQPGEGAPDGAARPLATVRPGKDGRFQIEASAGEPLRLRVEAEGYAPAERRIGGDPRLPPLRLRPAEDLELALAGPDGKPLAGLPVQLHPDGSAPRPETGGWRTPVQRAVSGPDGSVRFRRAAGEPVALFVAAPRLLGSLRQLAAGPSQRLVLPPGRPVTLVVTDPRGKPAPGARVLLPDGSEIGRTGATGRLEVAAPAEDLVLTVTAGAGLEAEIALSPATGPTLDVALQPALEVSGRVVDLASGQPIAGAHLEARCRAVTRSAADGGFQLAVPRTQDALFVRAAGYLPDVLTLEELAAQGQTPVTFALRPAAALAVRVVDEAGAPVGGAQVTAQPSVIGANGARGAGGFVSPVKVTSGPDGRARLTTAAGTDFEVTAEHDDFATARGTASTPKADELPAGSAGSDHELRLVLARGATAAGRLTTDRDEPLAGGTVALRPDPGGRRMISQRGKPHREAAAGPDGRFELRHLAPGRYQLTARAPGRVPAHQSIEVVAGTPRTDLGDVPLAPGAALEGRVLDERDRPVPGAAVFLMGEPGERQHVMTEADGAFRLADLEPGRVRVSVRREGYVQADLDHAIPSAEPLTVRLRPARTLTGRVVGPRGEPAAGALLHQVDRHEDGELVSQGVSSLIEADGEGRFRIALAAGPLLLQVEAAGFLTRELRIEIPEDRDPAPLEITLETGAVIEGRVLAAGQPVVRAEVSAHPRERPTAVIGTRVTTDGEGRFRLAGLATGRHAILAGTEDGRRGQVDVDVQPGTQQLDVHLVMGELTGRVVDAEGRPVAEAEVSLARSGGQEGMRSGTDGSFAFRSVAPGTYRLTAHHSQAGAAELPEVQVADRPVALPDLVLGPDTETATVAGRLLGLAQRDLRWARVMTRLLAPDGAAPEADGMPAMAQVAGDGTYQLAGLTPGTWEITAHAGERRPVRREVRLAAGERAAVDFTFAGGATLSGRVLLNGQPGIGLWVALDPDGGGVRSGQDGAFALRDLPPGAYTLKVTLQPGSAWSQAVEMTEEDREIEVQVATGALAGRVHSPAGPVAGARVTAEGRDGFGPSAVTGEDGAFQLRLLSGRYHVRVRADGAADLETDVEIAAGGEVRLDLPLP